MQSLQYLNNTWVSEKDLKISVFDLSVIRGFGVFDFLRTYHNKPFQLNAHIDRLFHSAKTLGIVIPKTKLQIKQIIEEGLAKNALPEKNIRIVVTGGITSDGITPGDPSFFIIFTKAVDYPQNYYENGVKIITYPHLRPFPEAKSLNYQAGIVALQQAKREKAIEAVFVGPKGEIYEGTTSNFFAVVKNTLITPPSDILYGITRKIVIDIAKKNGIKVDERKLFLSDIPKFEEAFITASNKEVMPVVKVNTTIIGKGIKRTITQRIQTEYNKLVGRQV